VNALNRDEYHPEGKNIVARLPRARSVEDVHTPVHEEFVRWFDDDTAGPADRHRAIARELWGHLERTGVGPDRSCQHTGVRTRG
jgi:hypothetical protein